MIDKTKLKAIAQKKLSTVKPGTNQATKKTINPLIKKRKRPKVKKLKGKVNKLRIGFKNVFKNPKNRATIIAV